MVYSGLFHQPSAAGAHGPGMAVSTIAASMYEFTVSKSADIFIEVNAKQRLPWFTLWVHLGDDFVCHFLRHLRGLAMLDHCFRT